MILTDFSEIADNPLILGHRSFDLLQEAVLRALELRRNAGYVRTNVLSQAIGWDADFVPSPNGQGYGRIAILGVLYRLYLDGLVEPAHQQNLQGHWGGWRITDREYARRRGEPPPLDSPPIGWVSLADYPLPRNVWPLPEAPATIRFPDGTERPLDHWERMLIAVVEWLNESRKLTPDNVPVPMSRRDGYLVNTEPVHCDGRPMARRTKAGGPDGLWVYTRMSMAAAWYAVFHTLRLLEYCDVDPSRVTLEFRGIAPSEPSLPRRRGRPRRNPVA